MGVSQICRILPKSELQADCPNSPKNSSLLQVFVSISGLVLVRHPYHCEPAFAKLEGTREGQINSLVRSSLQA